MKPTQSADASNFDTFTLFPKLPLELRLMVWKIAASAPRAFTIRFSDRGNYYKIKSQQKPPLIMCVNHKAREAGADMMQCRKLCFVILGKRPIHFSPKNNLVFFQNFNFRASLFIDHLSDYSSFRDGLKLVENVALCGRTHLDLFPNISDLVNFFKLLPNMKGLVVYRCEMMRNHQEMIRRQKGRVWDWISKRGAHLWIHRQLPVCWDVLRLENPDFQAPAMAFMEIGDIEALKSSPERWPIQR